jgi:hypothetical protein
MAALAPGPALPAAARRRDSGRAHGLVGLSGTITPELFGQFHNVVSEDPADRNAFFGEAERWAAQTWTPEIRVI